MIGRTATTDYRAGRRVAGPARHDRAARRRPARVADVQGRRVAGAADALGPLPCACATAGAATTDSGPADTPAQEQGKVRPEKSDPARKPAAGDSTTSTTQTQPNGGAATAPSPTQPADPAATDGDRWPGRRHRRAARRPARLGDSHHRPRRSSCRCDGARGASIAESLGRGGYPREVVEDGRRSCVARDSKVTISSDAHGHTAGWAATDLADALAVEPDPTAAAFFDIDNTMMQGASIYWFARGLAGPQVLHHRRPGPLRLAAAALPGARAENAGDMSQAKEAALAFIEGWRVDDIERLTDEIFDELMAPRIWAGTRALAQQHLDAGQRVWLVSAAPVEIGRIIAERLGLTGAHRHGRRDRRRRLHRPAGRRPDARPGQGRGGHPARRRRGPRPGPLHGLQRLGQRRADALRRRARRWPSTPTPPCAARPASAAGRSATSVPVARPPRSPCPRRSRRARRRRGERRPRRTPPQASLIVRAHRLPAA